MLALLKGLLSFLGPLFDWLRNSQLKKAGRDEQIVADQKEVERHVQQAEDAVRIPDPARDERLRRRFDRSRTGGGE